MLGLTSGIDVLLTCWEAILRGDFAGSKSFELAYVSNILVYWSLFLSIFGVMASSMEPWNLNF